MYCTKIGFYKGNGSIFNLLVKLFTFSKISHCAVITRLSSNYLCGYTSLPGDGVTYFETEYKDEEWEFFDLDITRIDIFTFFSKTQDCLYDYCGCINCIFKFHQHKSRYFCSEWCAELLKLDKPENYTPAKLYRYFKNKEYNHV